MKLEMRNQMRMELRMKLAPHMIQSMEILQLPILALQERIEQELNSNPVLEMSEHESHDDAGAAEEPVQDDIGSSARTTTRPRTSSVSTVSATGSKIIWSSRDLTGGALGRTSRTRNWRH